MRLARYPFLGLMAPGAIATAAALGRIATPEAVQTLTAALAGPAARRTAVADACLTAADQLIAAGKPAAAAAVYNAVRQADVAKHLQVAALQGAIRLAAPQTAGAATAGAATAGAATEGAATVRERPPRDNAVDLLVQQLRSDDEDFFAVALAIARQLPDGDVTQALVAELAKPIPPSDQPSRVLIIEKAEYGAADHWLDVTQPVAAAVHDNRLALTAGNDLAGDPARGTVKTLRVRYRLGDRQQTVEVREGEVLRIQGDPPRHGRRARIMEVLGDRGDRAALPVVLPMAAGGPWDLQLAAVRVLAQIGDASAAQLLEPFQQASTDGKRDLLDLLGVVGGPKALAAAAAAARSADEAVQDAATRVLGQWMSPDAAPVLLELTQNGNPKFRTRTLRGYIRIARQLDVPTDQRIAMCRQAFQLAERADEKLLVLEVLDQNPSPQSLAVALSRLNDPTLKTDAATTAVAIAKQLIRTQPGPVAEAMKQVIESEPPADVLAEAKRLLRRSQR